MEDKKRIYSKSTFSFILTYNTNQFRICFSNTLTRVIIIIIFHYAIHSSVGRVVVITNYDNRVPSVIIVFRIADKIQRLLDSDLCVSTRVSCIVSQSYTGEECLVCVYLVNSVQETLHPAHPLRVQFICLPD